MNNLLKMALVAVIAGGGTFVATRSLYQENASAVQDNTANTSQQPQSNSTFHTYPLDSAKADVDICMKLYDSVLNYAGLKMSSTQKNSAQIMAYTVSASDLLAALGLSDTLKSHCSYSHIRVYLGYHNVADNLPGDVADSLPHGFKLFVVPVAGAGGTCATCVGSDMFFDSSGSIISYPPQIPSTQVYVMDLNTPCPSFCDKSSPLYVTPKKY